MPAPTSGDEFLVYIDTNSIGAEADNATPVNPNTRNYVLISGQRGASLTYSLGVADVTDKDSSNWEESIATNRSGELTVEGVREEGDPGQDALRDANRFRNKVYAKAVTPAGEAWEGQFFVTEFNVEAPQDDAIPFSATLKLTGPLSEIS